MNYNKLDIAIKKSGKTKKMFIQETGLTEPGFYKMIKKRSIKVDVLEKMSDILNIPIAYWFDDSKEYDLRSKSDHDIETKLRDIIKNQNKIIEDQNRIINQLQKTNPVSNFKKI